jgi:hypothetical protein
MGPEIKPPSENNPFYYGYKARFTILSRRCIQTGQISKNMENVILDSTEETNKPFEIQANRECTAALMQRLGEMLGQVNPFADSYNECIK